MHIRNLQIVEHTNHKTKIGLGSKLICCSESLEIDVGNFRLSTNITDVLYEFFSSEQIIFE